jgi:tellurite methyltransferase
MLPHRDKTFQAMNRSIQFFDTQFRRQIKAAEYELNPFEQAVLPFISGRVVDLGCGLGNLAVAAAPQAASILAIDASPNAIDALSKKASELKLAINAEVADLSTYRLHGQFDTVVCIGLLMFFPPDLAHDWLERIKQATAVGGIVALNVLIEGTSYLDMFEPDNFTLFPANSLALSFAGWKLEYSNIQEFSAPNNSLKRFSTIVARKS